MLLKDQPVHLLEIEEDIRGILSINSPLPNGWEGVSMGRKVSNPNV
jgi:hypothetical protein